MEKEKEVFGEDFNILDGIDGLEDALGTPGNSDDIKPDVDPSDDELVLDGTDDNKTDTEQESSSTEENNDDDDDEETEDATSDDKDQSVSSPLTPYAKYLKEEGILPNINLDGEITPDSLRQAMFDEVMSGVDEYKSALPTEIHTLIDNYESGVPLDTLLKMNAEVVKYSSITDEQLADVDFQKKLYTEFLQKSTRYGKERIEREVNRLADLQELEDEAKSALQELVVLQKEEEATAVAAAKKAQADADAQRVKEIESLQQTINGTKEIIPGTVIPKQLKDKIFKNLTTAVTYDAAGNPLNKLGAYRSKNPLQTEIILNYLFEATNEFKDWTVFGKASKSKVLKELEDAATALDNKNTGNHVSGKRQSATTKSFLEEINNFIS